MEGNTAFQEKHLLPTVKWRLHHSLELVQGLGPLLKSRVRWSQPSINKFFRIMFKHHSQSWSLWCWTFQQDSDPKHSWKSTKASCRGRNTMLWNGHHCLLTWNVIENWWDDLKQAVNTWLTSDLNEVERFCKEEINIIPSRRKVPKCFHMTVCGTKSQKQFTLLIVK